MSSVNDPNVVRYHRTNVFCIAANISGGDNVNNMCAILLIAIVARRVVGQYSKSIPNHRPKVALGPLIPV